MDDQARSGIAEQIPFRFLIQHIGVSNEAFDERKFEAAMTSIEHLRAFAKPLGVRILLENIPTTCALPKNWWSSFMPRISDDVASASTLSCPHHGRHYAGL